MPINKTKIFRVKWGWLVGLLVLGLFPPIVSIFVETTPSYNPVISSFWSIFSPPYLYILFLLPFFYAIFCKISVNSDKISLFSPLYKWEISLADIIDVQAGFNYAHKSITLIMICSDRSKKTIDMAYFDESSLWKAIRSELIPYFPTKKLQKSLINFPKPVR